MIKQTKFLSKEDETVIELAKKYKLSVSSVKYSRGHDADCMQCNIKIGNKITATVWDDSWGGGLEYNEYYGKQFDATKKETYEKNFNHTMDILEKIKNEAPKYKFLEHEMEYSWDVIIDILIKNHEAEKKCKKKTFVLAINSYKDSEKKHPEIKSFEYNAPFGNMGVREAQIIQDFEKDNFIEIEIVNKRFLTAVAS